MRFLSTFSGVGGLEKGLEDAGWECAGQVEINEACQHWLGVHWPNVPKWRDIKTLTGDAVRSRIGHVDALVGGPPCQPASLAGKRLGSADDRWLWPDFLRLGRELSPKWILAENPPGIVTLKPHGLDWIMQELEEAGYQPFTVVMGADDVGAPHRRKRVWIVGRLGLADADSSRERDADELRRIEWASGAGTADVGRSGEGLADPSRDAGGQSPDGGADRERTRAGGHEGLGHPRGERLALGSIAEDERGDVRQEGPAAPQDGPRIAWPSRPGEPQHAWEAPRLAHTHSTRRRTKAGSGHPLDAGREPQPGRGALENTVGQPDRPEARGDEADRPHSSRPADRDSGSGDGDGMADSPSEPPRRPGQPRQEPDPRESESPMGGSVDGLPDGLAGLSSAHRREALKALGNAVCPWNSYVIGRAILSIEEQTA